MRSERVPLASAVCWTPRRGRSSSTDSNRLTPQPQNPSHPPAPPHHGFAPCAVSSSKGPFCPPGWARLPFYRKLFSVPGAHCKAVQRKAVSPTLGLPPCDPRGDQFHFWAQIHLLPPPNWTAWTPLFSHLSLLPQFQGNFLGERIAGTPAPMPQERCQAVLGPRYQGHGPCTMKAHSRCSKKTHMLTFQKWGDLQVWGSRGMSIHLSSSYLK